MQSKKPIILLLGAILCLAIVFLSPLKDVSWPDLSSKKEDKKVELKTEGEKEGEHKLEGRQTGVEKQLSMLLWSKGYPDPTYLNKKYWNGWLQAQEIKKNTQLLANNLLSKDASYGAWTQLGDVANIGGRVLSIAIDPTNTDRLFIGTASGGIYKSTNAGSSWEYVPTGYPVLGVASVLIDPNDPNVIYAGTGEVYRVDNGNIGYNVWKGRGTYGIGILKSSDGGVTWDQIFNKEYAEMFGIQMLKFDPTDANIIYACTTHGLYKSIDAGASWTNDPILDKTYVSDVAISPANPDILVAAVGNMVNPDKGVYRSTDGGASWSASPNATIGSSFNGYIRFDNVGSTRLFASVGNGSGNELYMSTNFGSSWIQKTNSAHCGGQYWFGHDVAVDPSNSNRVVMGGVSYYSYTSSSSTGSSGTRSGFASGVHADVHDIKFDPTNSNIIYIANDGGMYKTTNGSTFSRINTGMNATQFYASLAVSPTADIIIGGLQDNGVVRYNSGSWTSGLVGGDGGPCAFAPNGTTVIYSNDARAVYVSYNTGGSESQELTNLGYGYATAYDDRTAFMSPVAISQSDPTYMYAASDNLHVSTNGGSSFQRPDPGSMTRPIDAYYKPAITMALSPSDHNKMYVSTSPLSQRADDGLNYNPPARVMKSLNASNSASYTFADVTGTLPDRFVTDFAITTSTDDSVYITLGGYGTTHVYVTGDGGATWTPRGNGLPDVPFNAIVIDPLNKGILYAGCDLGIYVSPDRGANWYDFNQGLDDATLVMDLQISYDDKLIAATHGKGIFRSDLFDPIMLLPVKFTSFTGTNQGNYNRLSWNVSQEDNLSHYILERSDDGSVFEKVTEVTAQNSASPVSYNYNDNIGNNTSPTFYYRLKAVDVDGSYLYSEIVLIKIDKKNIIRIAGNPFNSHLTVQYNQPVATKMQIRLFDMQGKLIRHEETAIQPGFGTHTLNGLAMLTKGIYVAEIIAGNQRIVEKVVKN